MYAEFKSFANSDEFRTGTMAILDLLRDRRAVLLISDNRKLEGVSEHDQLWIRDTWMPMAVVAGLQRIAVVLARSGLGRIASEEIISESVGKAFVTRTFDTADAAREWIAGP